MRAVVGALYRFSIRFLNPNVLYVSAAENRL